MIPIEHSEEPAAPFDKSFGSFYPDALLVRLDVDPKEYLDAR